MKTLVLGASHNPNRYSYLAIKMLQEYGHEIVAIAKRARRVEDWEILEGMPDIKGIHTVTLYLNAGNQKGYYDYILGLKPKRVIFNPGAENPELYSLLQKNNIEAMEACTLVMLRVKQF